MDPDGHVFGRDPLEVEVMDAYTLIELYGLPGLIIFGLGWAYLAERSERKEAQKANLETLKEVIPAVAALQQALAYIERGGS
jgi:hypothetical protein